ncbi:DUF805 domain-containing protein [Spirosoma spitsbergense]|uniref:DUF805 domain-containing protein n=1 Tax=Spirosoma spitsbergense TaxID=431554 RepID=UPI000380735F|nr:DUF805 domain-containing protein [Spirosoma spitsbergense]
MNTSSPTAIRVSLLSNYVAVLKKYNDFDGRARRSEYWYFFLINVLISQGLNLINTLLFNGSAVVGWLIILFNLAILIPSVAVAVRRMHDAGKSGWYVLIPVYNLILACTESVKESNQYGANPKTKG